MRALALAILLDCRWRRRRILSRGRDSREQQHALSFLIGQPSLRGASVSLSDWLRARHSVGKLFRYFLRHFASRLAQRRISFEFLAFLRNAGVFDIRFSRAPQRLHHLSAIRASVPRLRLCWPRRRALSRYLSFGLRQDFA